MSHDHSPARRPLTRRTLTRRSLTRRSLLAGLALLALPALAACGKRSRVKLPPERAGEATWPRRYPPPSSVNPGAVKGSPAAETAPRPSPSLEGDGNETVGYEESVNDPYFEPFPEFEEEETQ